MRAWTLAALAMAAVAMLAGGGEAGVKRRGRKDGGRSFCYDESRTARDGTESCNCGMRLGRAPNTVNIQRCNIPEDWIVNTSGCGCKPTEFANKHGRCKTRCKYDEWVSCAEGWRVVSDSHCGIYDYPPVEGQICTAEIFTGCVCPENQYRMTDPETGAVSCVCKNGVIAGDGGCKDDM